jgi:hypothetical protein
MSFTKGKAYRWSSNFSLKLFSRRLPHAGRGGCSIGASAGGRRLRDFYDLSPTTQSIVGYFRIFGKDLQGFRPN